MTLDRAFRKEQTLGDLTVHVSHHDQAKNLLLPSGEHRRLDLSPVPARDTRLPGARGLQAGTERPVEILIEHDTRRACRQGSAHLPALDAGADNHDRRLREALLQRLKGLCERGDRILDPDHDHGVIFEPFSARDRSSAESNVATVTPGARRVFLGDGVAWAFADDQRCAGGLCDYSAPGLDPAAGHDRLTARPPVDFWGRQAFVDRVRPGLSIKFVVAFT